MDALGRLSAVFIGSHPGEAARIFERHPAKRVARYLAASPPAQAAAVIGASLPVSAATFLDHMDAGAAAAVLDALPVAQALPILRHQTAAQRDDVLEMLKKPKRDAYRKMLVYPQQCVGAFMNPFVFVLPRDITIVDAMRQVRSRGHDASYYPYVVDRHQKLVGILTVRELMLASPKERIDKVMQSDVIKLPVLALAEDLKEIPGRRAYQSLPVVDEQGLLVGVIGEEALRKLEAHDSGPPVAEVMTDGLMTLGESYFPLLTALLSETTNTVSAMLHPKQQETTPDAA